MKLQKMDLKRANEALISAAKMGHVEKLAECLALGGDKDAADSGGRSALYWAIKERGFDKRVNWPTGQSRLGCVRLLVEAGCEVDAPESGHDGPALLAAGNGDAAVLEILLRAGAAPNGKRNGESLAMAAVAAKSLDCLSLVVGAGVDVDARGKKSATALIRAAEIGAADCLAFLIQSSSDVDARDSRGKTGLIYAADAGHFDCVKMLVEAGCDILAVDARGHSAEFFAEASRAKGAKGCLEYLRVAKERLALDSAARPSSYTHASPRL